MQGANVAHKDLLGDATVAHLRRVLEVPVLQCRRDHVHLRVFGNARKCGLGQREALGNSRMCAGKDSRDQVHLRVFGSARNAI